jgi:hypothetical protein
VQRVDDLQPHKIKLQVHQGRAHHRQPPAQDPPACDGADRRSVAWSSRHAQGVIPNSISLSAMLTKSPDQRCMTPLLRRQTRSIETSSGDTYILFFTAHSRQGRGLVLDGVLHLGGVMGVDRGDGQAGGPGPREAGFKRAFGVEPTREMPAFVAASIQVVFTYFIRSGSGDPGLGISEKGVI